MQTPALTQSLLRRINTHSTDSQSRDRNSRLQREKDSTMGLSLGLNLLLLLAMVATNLLSLYHLSSLSSSPSTPPSQVSEQLQQQIAHLSTIRSTISHLTGLRSSSSASSSAASSDLPLYASFSPIASACHDYPELLRRYMTYTPFKPCPPDPDNLAETLSIRGCDPLPRRRCFSRTVPKEISSSGNPFPSSLTDSAVIWPSTASCKSFTCLPAYLGFDMSQESLKFLPPVKSNLDLTVPQFLNMANNLSSPIRLALDVGGGSGTFAARMKVNGGVTVLTTTLNIGAPFSEAVAMRGLIPLHQPLQQRFPVHDLSLDLVRCGRAVNRWIPIPALEFLMYDVDRVLRGGGFLWIDHFFCRKSDLEGSFSPVFKKLSYRILKWSVEDKADASGVKNGDVYLTVLMQKPVVK